MHQFQADQIKIAQHLHGDTATLQQLRETSKYTNILWVRQKMQVHYNLAESVLCLQDLMPT